MKKKLLKLFLIIFISFGVVFLIRIPPETVTIGTFTGECIDQCGTIYTISKYRITRDTYNEVIYPFENKTPDKHVFIEEDHDGSFNDVKPWIPLLMIFENRKRIGCPDCYDQGGVILKFTLWGKEKSFVIDTEDPPVYFWDMNERVRGSMDKIENKIK